MIKNDLTLQTYCSPSCPLPHFLKKPKTYFSFWFYFWGYDVITTFSFSFLLLKLPIYSSLLIFKFAASFFTNYKLNVGTHTHIFIYSKYILFSLYSVTYMFGGLTICYWTTNWMFFPFSLGKTISPSPSFPQLLITLCIGLRPCRLFLV